jgi:regulator of protease activity HflC (stomatin/prohibitin superfamily)
MKRIFAIVLALFMSFSLTGCFTVVEEGKVGVVVTNTGEIKGAELPGGNWYHTFFRNIKEFQVRDISFNIDNKQYTTSEDVPLGDFDMTVSYSVNPQAVAEAYKTRSKAYNANNEEGDTLLMYNRVATLANGSAYQVVRGYTNLQAADKRAEIERKILDATNAALKADGAEGIVQVNTVTVRNIAPNQSVLDSSTAVVKSANELRVKANEVEIAKKEAERMAALSQNSTASIAYMNAQANLNFSNAALQGKVQTMIVPHGMSILGVGK